MENTDKTKTGVPLGELLKSVSVSVAAPAPPEKPASGPTSPEEPPSGPPTPPIPGLELLGRGIHLKPRQPYELKQRLVNKENDVNPDNTPAIYCSDTGKSYLVPKEYEINLSPPMPANQTLNQTLIEHNFESLESHLEVDANIAAGLGAFSIKANYSQIDQLRSSEEAYYALRTSLIPFWTVDYIGQPDVSDLEKSVKDVHKVLKDGHKKGDERSQLVAVVGEDDTKWMYDLPKLLGQSSPSQDDLTEIRKLAVLIPGRDYDKELNESLKEKDVLKLRDDFKGFFIEQQKKAKFERTRRARYERVFQQFGTHFVKRVWVGGTATLAFAITKSGETDVKKIQAGINASYATVGAGAGSNQEENLATLKENSTCSVWGKGGDESALAGLNSLDQELYNDWLKSVKQNPTAIELEVVGIWSLLREKDTNELTAEARTLREAYRTIYEFEPIAALFSPTPEAVYFVKSSPPQQVDQYLTQAKKMDCTWPKLKDHWKRISFDRIDAAFAGTSLRSKSEKDDKLDTKVFFFRKDEYICLDVYARKGSPVIGPRPIAERFPGVTFDSVDAVLNAGPDSIYFFRGDEYIRFNWTKNRADFEPRKFREHWAGVTFDRIDAALYWGNGKAYFFRGDRYIAYDMVTYRADPGYPKYLPGSYVQDWKIFD